MNATTLKSFVDDAFSRLENAPIIRRLARVKARLEDVHQKIDADLDAIAVTIPDGSPWTVIVDAVITWIETKYPALKIELEWIRALLDALFASPPPVPA